jgi:hypothetical protein
MKSMKELTINKDYTKQIIDAENFDIFTMHKGQGNRAKIYIEGDGHAWKNRRVISNDPTPINPVALKLANNDNDDLVVYIARPCQYSMRYGYNKGCKKSVWTSDRFSIDALTDINYAIDHYKNSFNINEIELIGFSGGGAISMLLTTMRDDITKITTFAGNLDTEKWVKYHNISPLTGSLNPADFKDNYIDIPQVHYVGTQDEIVPMFIAYEFIKNMKNAKIIEVDTTHGGLGNYYE